MTHTSPRFTREKLWWLLSAAAIAVLVCGTILVVVPYIRTQAAIGDLQAIMASRKSHVFDVERHKRGDRYRRHTITLVSSAPDWLRRLTGDRYLAIFDHVERIDGATIGSGDELAQQLPRFVDLRALHLRGESDLTDSGLEAISRCSQLEELEILSSGYSDDGVAHLTMLTQLKHLSLGNSRITDAGIAHLEQMQRLETLSLKWVSATDDSLGRLSQLKRLRSLCLGGRRVSDVGIEYLASLPELETLLLDHAAVAGDGLAAFKGHAKLRHLWISNCPITDADLVHFKELPKLKLLTLRETNVTQKGIDALRHEFPRLRIDFKPRTKAKIANVPH